MYLVLKLLHFAAVIAFLGNITTGLFWHAHAARTRDARLLAHTMNGIVRSDRLFTIPGVIVIIVSGLAAAIHGGLPLLRTGWILWTLVLFSISGLIFMLRVAPLQRQLYALAESGVQSGDFEYARYHALAVRWEIWGAAALMTPVAVIVWQQKRQLRMTGPAASIRLEISEEPITALAEYACVPISFEVTRVLDVSPREDGHGGFRLTERAIATPWVKDYDAIPGEGPATWPKRFDLSHWGLFAARLSGRRVGGAAVAFQTPGLEMLEGREDLAVLWDLRVAPDARGQGVGLGLLHAAEAWARARGCREMKVETQNINVPACRFYAKHGFALRAADRFAYPTLPDETMLLWYKDLIPGG